MAREALYYLTRLAVNDRWSSLLFIPEQTPENERVELAMKGLEFGQNWAQAYGYEVDRLALVLRDQNPSIAANLQEDHAALRVLVLDTVRDALLEAPVRLWLARMLAPALAGSLWAQNPSLEPHALLPHWRNALRQQGRDSHLLHGVLRAHSQLIAFAVAESLKLAWRPEVQPGSTISEIPIPISYFQPGPKYLYVMNNLPYHAVREALAFGSFARVEDSPWPTVPLRRNSAGTSSQSQAQMFPVEMEMQPYRDPEEQANLVRCMWEQVSELNDLDADVLDMLSAIWLEQASGPNDFARIEVNQMLRMRGLKAKRGEGGRQSGFRAEQKAQLFRALQHISNVYLTVNQSEFGKEGHRQVRSRAFVITDVAGNHTGNGGTLDIDQILIRPGVLFGHFLYGPGRQMALLSSKAIQYDRIREDWEKRLARYFSWQWRNDAMNQRPTRTFLVQTLLDSCGKRVDEKHPKRTRQRLEKALQQLADDQVIASWRWAHHPAESKRLNSWSEDWVSWRVAIEQPEDIRNQYQQILPLSDEAVNPAPQAMPKQAGLLGRATSLPRSHPIAGGETESAATRDDFLPGPLFSDVQIDGQEFYKLRKRIGWSQAQMAKLLLITQSYYSHLERGSRPMNASLRARLKQLSEEFR